MDVHDVDLLEAAKVSKVDVLKKKEGLKERHARFSVVTRHIGIQGLPEDIRQRGRPKHL